MDHAFVAKFKFVFTVMAQDTSGQIKSGNKKWKNNNICKPENWEYHIVKALNTSKVLEIYRIGQIKYEKSPS